MDFLLWLAMIIPFALAASEQEILLEFKQGIVDSNGALWSWNPATNPRVCSWDGIKCNSNNDVVGVDFSNFNLDGTISSVVCELQELSSFTVLNNSFKQEFPSGLENCHKLIHLDLSQNWFFGDLPSNISLLGRVPLRSLDLSANSFTGAMPDALGQLPTTLQELSLRGNLFTHLTPSLGRLTNLTVLQVAWNQALLPASIPPEFGNLTKLRHLEMSGCNLVGSIPPELGQLKELDYLELQHNNLTGSIPVGLMYLPKLTKLELYDNKLSGPIPREIRHLSLLTDFDASQNILNGSIPAEVGDLKDLRLLQLYLNELTGTIPASLAGLEHLEVFSAYLNSLTGEIPQTLGKNSRLSYVGLSKNMLTGMVPPYVCAGNALQNLSLYDNNLSGRIPESLADCKTFVRLQLQNNELEGPVPPKLWANPNMTLLDVSSNRLNGTVTSDVKDAAHLGILKLNSNRFEGALPDELGNLPNLVKLSASDNLISGFHFGRCSSLESLDLSHNLLPGTIPADIGNCMKLITIDLSANSLSGQIPSSLGDLSRLNMLNLSDNHLSGRIPSVLGNLQLSSLDISNNNLNGAIPKSWSRNFPSASFAGNPNLCELSCWNATVGRNRGHASQFPVSWTVVLVGGVILLLLAALRIWLLKSRSTRQPPQWNVKSFQRLSFNELAVVEKLDHNNVIGSGRSGKVYRVDLPDGQSVAVKQHSRSGHGYAVEVEVLGQTRHRNIIKLLSCCWNASTELLIFEYMPNGSLRDALHSEKVADLDWNKRYKIALGVAQALAYLHHDCCPPVLHRDVKSANILLDSDYEPKLADLGIAKLIKSSGNQTMTNFAGSYGYIAPEYAYTLKVNMKSDTYSFGVVLLELVTGKRPVDNEYEDVDMVGWVKSIIGAKGPQLVLDPRLSDSVQDQMITMINVALLCTSESPEERPTMRRVVEMLKEIKPSNCYSPSSKEDLLSPASTFDSSPTRGTQSI